MPVSSVRVEDITILHGVIGEDITDKVLFE